MNICFPAETHCPDDGGTFRRTRRMMPVPNKTVVIEEEWTIQEGGTILVLEEWNVEVCDE